MLRQPEPKPDILARRDDIVAGLRALLPAEAVIAEPLRLKPYETDGLPAYRQLPLAVVLPDTTYMLISDTHQSQRRIFTDGRDWPAEIEPAYHVEDAAGT